MFNSTTHMDSSGTPPSAAIWRNGIAFACEWPRIIQGIPHGECSTTDSTPTSATTSRHSPAVSPNCRRTQAEPQKAATHGTGIRNSPKPPASAVPASWWTSSQNATVHAATRNRAYTSRA